MSLSTFKRAIMIATAVGLTAVCDVGFAQTSHPLTDLPAGHWYMVPSSRMDSANPCPDVVCPPGNSGIQGVMIAWSGGTYDTTRDKLLVWGGGHADYAGNEIYGFDIESLTWSRVSEPSSSFGGDASTYLYPDGKPRALHTWGYIEYVPPLDSFVSFGGVAPYPISGTTRKVFQYKFSNNTWDVNALAQIPPGGSSRGANAVYDTATGDVWVLQADKPDSRLHRYNPQTNAWTTHSQYFLGFYSVAAIDPERRLLVTVGGDQIKVWDLNNPNAAPVVPSTTGAKYLESESGPGFAYDSTIKQFVGWSDGAAVYTLDPETWHWTRRDAAGENSVIPTNADQRGTYGRFQYVPKWNAYVVVNNTNQNVYFYRLSDDDVAPAESINDLQ